MSLRYPTLHRNLPKPAVRPVFSSRNVGLPINPLGTALIGKFSTNVLQPRRISDAQVSSRGFVSLVSWSAGAKQDSVSL